MMVEAQAQRYEDHQKQRAAVAIGAGFIVIAAILLTTTQLQVYERKYGYT